LKKKIILKKTFLLLILLVFTGYYSNSQYSFLTENEVQSDNEQIQEKNDTLTSNFSFFDSGWKRHNHILDYQFVAFEANSGALGYSYLFKPIEKLKIGARLGGWFRYTGQDVPAFQARKSYIYSISALVNFNVWRSFNVQSETGLSQAYSRPQKTNSFSQYSKWESVFYEQRIIINTVVYKHFLLNFGYQITFDPTPNNFYNTWLFGVGFKI
jgi:hypothetical protein